MRTTEKNKKNDYHKVWFNSYVIDLNMNFMPHSLTLRVHFEVEMKLIFFSFAIGKLLNGGPSSLIIIFCCGTS